MRRAKRLQWKGDHPHERFAEAPFGSEYVVQGETFHGNDTEWLAFTPGDEDGKLGYHPTEEAAQAACQSHFDAAYEAMGEDVGGWVSVPIEPTEAMLKAGEYAWMHRTLSPDSDPLSDCYRAMIAAAKKEQGE